MTRKRKFNKTKLVKEISRRVKVPVTKHVPNKKKSYKEKEDWNDYNY